MKLLRVKFFSFFLIFFNSLLLGVNDNKYIELKPKEDTDQYALISTHEHEGAIVGIIYFENKRPPEADYIEIKNNKTSLCIERKFLKNIENCLKNFFPESESGLLIASVNSIGSNLNDEELKFIFIMIAVLHEVVVCSYPFNRTCQALNLKKCLGASLSKLYEYDYDNFEKFFSLSSKIVNQYQENMGNEMQAEYKNLGRSEIIKILKSNILEDSCTKISASVVTVFIFAILLGLLVWATVILREDKGALATFLILDSFIIIPMILNSLMASTSIKFRSRAKKFLKKMRNNREQDLLQTTELV